MTGNQDLIIDVEELKLNAPLNSESKKDEDENDNKPLSSIEKFFDENNSLSYSDQILNTVSDLSGSEFNVNINNNESVKVRETFVNVKSTTELEEEIEKVQVEDSDAEKFELFQGQEINNNTTSNNNTTTSSSSNNSDKKEEIIA